MAKEIEIRGQRIKLAKEDRRYYIIMYVFVTIMTLLVLYPIIYILSCSFSSGKAVSAGKVKLLPVDLSLLGYKAVFSYPKVWIGYRNTIFYTVVGTINNVACTIMCAYPLSRKDLPGKKAILWYFMFTMYFSGGLIPTYLLMKSIGYINTIWAIILPGSFGVYQMIVLRTFIGNEIPMELFESARIDGCNDFKYLFSFVLPLTKASLAVITLQYAIGMWNSYFSAFVYLTDEKKMPLQLFLREILIMNTYDTSNMEDPELIEQMMGVSDLLKYSLIVVATVPILAIYPFMQKYFVKGVMVGSLKG